MAYPYPVPRPSAVSAIFAAILSIIGGAWHLFGLFWWGWYPTISNYLSKALDGVIGILLLVGAILLLNRKRAGRALAVTGTVIAIVGMTTGLVLALIPQGVLFINVGGPVFLPGFFDFILDVLPAIVTLVLLLVPPTTKWLSAPPAVPMYPQQQYPYPPGTHPPYPPAQPYQQGGRPPGW